MGIAGGIAGAYRFGPESGRLLVHTTRTGLGAKKGTGGVKPLSDADRAEIHKTLKEVLHTGQHPTITFRSRRVDGSVASFTCDGELTIMGVTQPVALQGRVTDGRVVGEATVVQSRWGIRPYSAFFGALKLSDEVKVDFDVALTWHG